MSSSNVQIAQASFEAWNAVLGEPLDPLCDILRHLHRKH
jgi:hypothetical protein